MIKIQNVWGNSVFFGKMKHFGMKSGHHMAHMKKKLVDMKYYLSGNVNVFCVKFVSQEKKLVHTKKSSGIWQLAIYVQRFNIRNCSFKKLGENCQNLLNFSPFFLGTNLKKDERFSILLNRLSSSIYEYFKIFASHSRHRKQNNRIAMVFMFTFREKTLS